MTEIHHDARVVKIDEYTSTAYDKVATVADNIDAILNALATSENDHSGLINLDTPNQHPQAAITGLVEALAVHTFQITSLENEDIDLAALLQQHADLVTKHFEDVPEDDDISYLRKNREWVAFDITEHTHDADYAAIDHDHGTKYAPLVHTHDYAATDHTHDYNYDADYLGIDMLDTGTTLPDPAGYPEGAVFMVHE